VSIFNKQTKPETIIYTIVWIVLFLAPVAELLINFDPEHPVWIKKGLIDSWVGMLMFLIVFLIHNHVLAPLLIKHKKGKLYIIGCIAVIALFQTYHCIHKPTDVPRGPAPENRIENIDPPHGRPPVDKHDISVFTIVILMIGANLGVKAYFQSEEEKKRIAALREQSLKQELDYLRYQINPHFIMNTLNNIHALVDIDPEQAKDSIVGMSRMMRYLLYDSDKHLVSLNNAIIFLKKYINLMKLRYTDSVTIDLDVKIDSHDEIVIVPLVFIPFVENAFKHGVSYNKPSTINIGIERNGDRLFFHCLNSKSNAQHEYGGVGLNNVTKRLELIYGKDYSLDINDEEETYEVKLELPVKYPDDFKQVENNLIQNQENSSLKPATDN